MDGPYRKLHREVDLGSHDDSDKALAVFSVSGSDGARGRDGNDGADGSGSGSSGGSGGNAATAHAGVDAGQISLTLSKGDDDGFLHLSGTSTSPDGSETKYDQSLLIGNAGTVDLLANGVVVAMVVMVGMTLGGRSAKP